MERKQIGIEQRQKAQQESLQQLIEDFDRRPYLHGLPKDWYKFQGIGFSMKGQMNLLKEGQEQDPTSLDVWTQQTKRDVLGFALEYLSKGLVFAYKYRLKEYPDGRRELVDPLYGDKGMIDTVDSKERGGVVKETLARTQEFFLHPDTPDGAIAVLPSPKGPSGLFTDKGEAIDYPDSFFFVMQKKGDEVIGSTIKTDFSNKEYRAVIYALTGQKLPFDASLQDFVKAAAFISPNERRESVNTVDDIIGVLKDAKLQYRDPKENNGYAVDTAYKDRKWDEVFRDVARGEELYNFNATVKDAIAEFELFVAEGNHTRLDLQKALAATLLRVSKDFISEQQAVQTQKKKLITKVTDGIRHMIPIPAIQPMSYGHVFSEVQKIEGCAGGGGRNEATSVMTMGGYRGARVESRTKGEDESSWFECPKCEQRAKPPVGESCPHCHYTKADFVRDHPELAC